MTDLVSHPGDPIVLVREALARAKQEEPFDATAMTLATVSASGAPAARVVLLKGIDDRGFVFYTNYKSRKARELSSTKVAAIAIHWPKAQEQVRVEGTVEQVSAAESDAYFRTRPRESQLGAWASLQREELADRASLEARFDEITRRYEGKEVPRPPHWGGFRVVPSRIELWYGRASRLHERHVYERDAVGAPWRHRLLFP
ncbi:MAG: pyridoxamine 5'-phosphate oxidase [Polyangiaceae bacterium]|nr:pyridoxamine 5'-phosphate oxidase [Polyangiaceae bacterium]